MRIPLNTLHSTSRYPRMLRTVIAYNLSSQNARGAGNKARRRAGLPVIDPSTLGPWGSIGMNTAEIAKMMRTPPPK